MDKGRSQTEASPGPEERASNPEDIAATHPTEDEDQNKEERDDAADETSADSFPSSDAPSW